MSRYIFTSESVSEGHPDKICDQISDAILDAYLTQDPEHRVAVETTATTNFVLLAGETKGKSNITADDLKQITRDTVKRIGYEQDEFHWNKIEIDCRVHAQSADIAVGVDATGAKEEGAGDQGIMFGYACKETPELMPAAIMYAHRILNDLSDDRHKGVLSMLGPDAKSQVSLIYENGKPVGVHSVVLSTQHIPGLSQADVKEIVRPYVARVLPQGWTCPEDQFYVNPTGQFIIGGPDGDTGLTGRKIIVDTYGGAAPHGGGAFSGKDPTKVDRSAAYAARYLAKNIVAADLAEKCTVQLSYAIGVPHPISVYLDTHGTSQVDTDHLSKVMQQLVDLSPKGIRTHLGLNKPIYARTASYGHFGRTPDADGGFSWEKTDLVDALKKAF
jgi:S-adenosylmethionine synthetase